MQTSREEKPTLKLLPSLAGKELYADKALSNYLDDIKSLVSCPADIYQELYLETLYRFAELCQAMPVNQDDQETHGLLRRQLMLAVATLKLRRGMLFPKSAGAEQISLEEPQWTYALFLAALLKDIHHLAVDRQVSLYYKNTETAGHWHILSGSLYTKNLFYHVTLKTVAQPIKTDIVMATLIGRIVPASALRWIANNNNLFTLWWPVLLQASGKQNELLMVIQLAENKLDLPQFMTSLDASPALNKETTTHLFLTWLLEVYQNHPDGIFRFQDGLFVNDVMLDFFLLENTELSKQTLLQTLNDQHMLITVDSNYMRTLVPKNFEDRRRLHGIVLNETMLHRTLRALPPSPDYINQFPL